MLIGKTRTNQPVESSKQLDDKLEELEESLGTKLYEHTIVFYNLDGNEFIVKLITNEETPISFSALKDHTFDKKVVSGTYSSDVPQTGLVVSISKDNANANLQFTILGDNDGEVGVFYLDILNDDLDDETLSVDDEVVAL